MFHFKSRFAKLFISYVLLLLPIFLVYLFMTQGVLGMLRKETDARSQALLQQVERELSLGFESYYNTSVQLSNSLELLRYKMVQNAIYAKKGIELLATIKSYDVAIKDLFMYYDNDKIYADTGLTDASIYFAKALRCTQESIDRSLGILTNPSKGLHLLNQISGSGYILYHYPVRWNTEGASVSVNFLLNVSVLADVFEQLLKKCETYVVVSFSGGERLVFHGNAEEALSLERIGDDADGVLDADGYIAHSVYSGITGMTVSVYYEEGAIYGDVNRRQSLSYGIMAVLLFLSVYISFIMSRKYHAPIHRLAARIASQRHYSSEPKDNIWRKTDELEYLNKTFGLMMDEREQMSRGLEEYKVILRPQTALLLFHGLIREAPFIDKMLELCDYEFHEDYFVLLSIVVQYEKGGAEAADAILKEHFEEDLYCNVSIEDQKVLTVLAGIPNLDYTCKYRRKIEDDVRRMCGPCGAGRILISFSRIYKDSSMIPYAYNETIRGIECLLTSDAHGDTAYFEKTNGANPAMRQGEEEELDRWESALRLRDQEAAKGCLNRLFYNIEYNRYSHEIKQYLQYCILQRLIQVIKEIPDGRDGVLLPEAMRINPAADGKFDDAIYRLMMQVCFTEEKEDAIQKVIRYIEENYSRYDLSLDEVARFAGLSKTYLSKLFKEKTGKRYIDYLSELRLEESKRLLSQTEYTIREIVRRVGYYDVPRFRKKFKATYGINASQYRKGDCTRAKRMGESDQ